MRLGTQTGSMTNHIYSRATKGQPDPVVGMGATILCWTDRLAGTIVAVYERKMKRQGFWHVATIVEVQRDTAVNVGSIQTEDQTWTYTPNPKGEIEYFCFIEKQWHALDRNPKTGALRQTRGGHGLRIGVREAYCDPCF